MKFVNVYNDIRTILAKLDKIEKRDRKNFYNPNIYVKIFDGVELVLVYNGVYFKSSNLAALSKTLERRGITVDSRTLKRLADDEERWCEL